MKTKNIHFSLFLATVLVALLVNPSYAQGNLPEVPPEGTQLYTANAASSGGNPTSSMTADDVAWSQTIESDIAGYGKLTLAYRSFQGEEGPHEMYFRLADVPAVIPGAPAPEQQSQDVSAEPIAAIDTKEGNSFFRSFPWSAILLWTAWGGFCYFVVFPAAQISQEIKTLTFDLSGLVARTQGIMKLHFALQCKLSANADERAYFTDWEDVERTWEATTRNFVGTRIMHIPLEEVVTTLHGLIPDMLGAEGIALERKGVEPIKFALAVIEYEQGQQDAMSAGWKATMRNAEIKALMEGLTGTMSGNEAMKFLVGQAFAEGLGALAENGIKVNLITGSGNGS